MIMSFIWTMLLVVWLVVGFKRIPVYYKRCDEHNAKLFPYSHEDNGMKTSAAVATMLLTIIWPLYEAGRWAVNYVIRTADAEQRAWDEYVKDEEKS